MMPAKKASLLKALRYWGASFAVVAGLMFYKSTASVGAVLSAGLITFLLIVGRAFVSH